jgi:hypothetical protein
MTVLSLHWLSTVYVYYTIQQLKRGKLMEVLLSQACATHNLSMLVRLRSLSIGLEMRRERSGWPQHLDARTLC